MTYIFHTIHLSNDVQLSFTSEEPIEHRFDEVTVVCRNQSKTFIVFDDIIQEAVCNLHDALSKCLMNELTLDSNLNVGMVGKAWNNWAYNYNLTEREEGLKLEVLQRYWVWSTSRGYQTWIYQYHNKTFIEMSPSYKWHFDEPTKDENFISFEEFMKDYEPLVIELSLEQIREILDSLEQIKKDLEIFF